MLYFKIACSILRLKHFFELVSFFLVLDSLQLKSAYLEVMLLSFKITKLFLLLVQNNNNNNGRLRAKFSQLKTGKALYFQKPIKSGI